MNKKASDNSSKERCPKCALSFIRLASHFPHCKGSQKEKEKDKERCSKCGDNFIRLVSHLPYCKGKPEEKCPKCGESFTRLASHLPFCKGKPEEKCLKCGESFTRLASHLPLCKGKPEEKCPKCGESFTRLASHLPFCKGKPEERCPKCGESFTRLASHLSFCKGKPEEKCPKCGESFTRLASHLPFCKGKPEEKCPKCGESFTRLASHLSFCKGKPEERCPKCGESFTRLASHLPYCKASEKQNGRDKSLDRCPKCKESFIRLASHLPRCKATPKPSKQGRTKEIPVNCGASVRSPGIFEACDECKQPMSSSAKHKCKKSKTKMPAVPNDPKYNPDPKAELEKLIQDAKLEPQEVSEGAKFIKELSEQLVKSLNGMDAYFQWTLVTSGSYYEKVKVCHPNEFDLMITTSLCCSAKFGARSDPYCSVEVNGASQTKLSKFLTEGKWLSPKSVKDHLVQLIPGALRDFRQGRHITLQHSKKSPAIKLECLKDTYKQGDHDRILYEVDLVPCIKIPQFPPHTDWPAVDIKDITMYAVTKTAPAERTYNANQDKLWRISFSSVEKTLVLHAGDAKTTCHKMVLRVMKIFLERAKEDYAIKGLSSYHIKTFMLHQFYKGWPNHESWNNGNFRTRLQCAIEQFQRVLRERTLRHFFLKDVNLTKDVEEKDIESFCTVLEDWKRQV